MGLATEVNASNNDADDEQMQRHGQSKAASNTRTRSSNNNDTKKSSVIELFHIPDSDELAALAADKKKTEKIH